MDLFRRFILEVKSFSKTNWWIYPIYFLMLFLIILDGKKIASVAIITSIHFIADIFIMMMFSAYSTNEFVKGTLFQIISMILFTSLKIYTGFAGDGWHYIAADPLYFLAAIKNYRLDILKKDTRIINSTSLSILSFFIIFFILFPIGIFHHLAQWIQTIGIFLFAIALASNKNLKLRYILSIISLSGMVTGSFYEMIETWQEGKVVGLDLSYSLLPLTVLIFYIKTWQNVKDQSHLLGIAEQWK